MHTKHIRFRPALLERMPVIEKEMSTALGINKPATAAPIVSTLPTAPAESSNTDSLMSLLDFGIPAPAPVLPSNGGGGLLDFLGDMSLSSAPSKAVPVSNGGGLMDLFGSTPAPSKAAPVSNGGGLMDLFGSTPVPSKAVPVSNGGGLMDLFGPTPVPSKAAPVSNGGGLMDLFGSSPVPSKAAPVSSQPPKDMVNPLSLLCSP